MPLIEEFETSGNWLFKRRGFLPILLVVAGLILIALTDYTQFEGFPVWYTGICLAVGFVGILIRAITIGHTPKHTSGRNIASQKASVVNTSGIYSVVRHPLYLGNFFMWLGLILFIGHPWFAVVAVFVFWLYYERIMFAEEAFLRQKFGTPYEEWASVTPTFIPRFNKWRRAELPFSMRNVLKREYNGFGNLVAMYILIEFVRSSLMAGKATLSLPWLIFFGVSFIVWLTVRTIEKTTGWFEVEGR
jgi:protein-S-isoprenylcysteine O-methyltransferase Ste14